MFGGGNFWGLEEMFKKEFKAKIKTVVGFMSTEELHNPDYEELETGVLGHVQIV